MDPFSAVFNELLVSTYRSVTKVEELMLRSMSQDNLSISELHMLESIARDRADGRSITDIAQEMDISLPSVTTAIKKLEKKGYVTKAKDVRDGRVVNVKLTQLGLRAEVAHRFFHRKMVRAVTQSVTEDEKRILLDVMLRLSEFFRDQASELERAEHDQNEGR